MREGRTLCFKKIVNKYPVFLNPDFDSGGYQMRPASNYRKLVYWYVSNMCKTLNMRRSSKLIHFHSLYTTKAPTTE